MRLGKNTLQDKLAGVTLAVLLANVFFAINAQAFTYNQKMLAYKGGVISELNNCGIHYTDNGKYLRGHVRFAARLDATSKYVQVFDNLGDGIVSLLSTGEVVYSPDGKHIDGGSGIVVISSAGENLFVHGDDVVVSASKPFIYGLSIRYANIIQNAASSDRTSFEVLIPDDVRFIGGNGSSIYVQMTNGDIRTSTLVSSLGDISNMDIIHQNAPLIRKIIPYGTGSVVLTDAGLFRSYDANHLISGSGTSLLYSGSREISGILNYGGDTSLYGPLGLIVAFKDGYIYHSPDGENIAGGGRTFRLAKPIDVESIQEQLQIYLDSMVLPPIGHLTASNIRVELLNQGESAYFAENEFVLNGGGTSRATGMASTLAGEPARVRVYDKGWSGWEYKWRDRGTSTGIFSQEVDGKIIGKTEVKVKAEAGCAAVIALEQITVHGEPFSYTWDINADGTIADSTNEQLLQSFFVEGEIQFDYGINPYLRTDKAMTWFEWIMWASYELTPILDAYQNPMKGAPVSEMTDASPDGQNPSYPWLIPVISLVLQ